MVALKHPDHDHIDGLYSVLENFRVGQLWIGRDQDNPAFKSLVAEARALGIPVLLTGDIEKKAESGLVEEHAPIESDFPRVPHHRSKTSSTEEFLEAVAPKVAVASVGEGNSFGHPAPIVVERYARAGVRFLRTDRDGAVTALTDGRSLSVRTFVNPAPVSFSTESRTASGPN